MGVAASFLVTLSPVAQASVVTTPKKGVTAIAYGNDTAKLAALGSSWYYDWHYEGRTANGVQYVPMVWGSGTANNATVMRRITDGAKQGRFNTLLGFNEPDGADQANLTPEQALALWPKLQATGTRLGSPAPANYWGGWLDAFMKGAQAKKYRVDFITLHYYPDFTDPNAANNLMAMVDDAWNKWRKPIWITEIGAIDISAWGMPALKASPTEQHAVSFMREATSRLEASPAVERYSWFIDNGAHDPTCRFTTLFGTDGLPTALGKAYAAVAPAPRVAPDARVGQFRLTNKAHPVALQATDDAYDFPGTRRLAVSPSAWSSTEQRWAITSAGAGAYRVTSLSQPGMVLQTTGESYRGLSGAYAVALTPSSWNLPEQLWQVVAVGDGHYRFVNQANGAVLQSTYDQYQGYAEVFHAATTPNPWNSAQQQWRLSS